MCTQKWLQYYLATSVYTLAIGKAMAKCVYTNNFCVHETEHIEMSRTQNSLSAISNYCRKKHNHRSRYLRTQVYLLQIKLHKWFPRTVSTATGAGGCTPPLLAIVA